MSDFKQFKEVLEAVQNINDKIYEMVDSGDYQLILSTDGYVVDITFAGVKIWRSDEDERYILFAGTDLEHKEELEQYLKDRVYNMYQNIYAISKSLTKHTNENEG